MRCLRSVCPSFPLIEQATGAERFLSSRLPFPDSHTIKSCRSLLYGASRLGSAPPGGIPGSTDAAGSETIAGMAKLDGTLFIRVAGQLMDYMGWDKGEENEWDRTALGWDEAWEESKEEKEKREKEEDSHHAA
jgi:hypothetical protein